jgi:CRISPR-associated endoribonuclease Cas6
MSNISYKQLIDNTYFANASDLIKVYFNTPTSFKIDGRYIIYPNIASIYKNLIRKFDTFSNEFALYDEEMLESLIDNSVITSYNLRSCSYSLESVRIPSFTGMITLKIHSSAQLAGLARLLFGFGEYSGIGIKTALGMGAMKTEEVKRFEKR